MMKKMSFALAAASLMTLAACQSPEAEAVENAGQMQADNMDGMADNMDDMADDMSNDTAAEAMENAADNMTMKADNVEEMADEKADNMQ